MANILGKCGSIRPSNEKPCGSLLVELKARVEGFEKARKTMESLAAKHSEIEVRAARFSQASGTRVHCFQRLISHKLFLVFLGKAVFHLCAWLQLSS